jgi:hypothetical protein
MGVLIVELLRATDLRCLPKKAAAAPWEAFAQRLHPMPEASSFRIPRQLTKPVFHSRRLSFQ